MLVPDDAERPMSSAALRPATAADVTSLNELIRASARGLSHGYYTHDETEAAIRYVFGVDSLLVADGTYFVIEDSDQPVACGGWSRRRTMYGGDQRPMGGGELLDPAVDPARIRAFFVAPSHARRGLGARLLDACSQAAAAAGFTRLELMSTLPGVPFYSKLGFDEIEPVSDTLPDGTVIRFVRMRRLTEAPLKPFPSDTRMHWRRLDGAGQEQARIEQDAGGWRLTGAVDVTEAGVVARLTYSIECDARWTTRAALVEGTANDVPVRFALDADGEGNWSSAGSELPHVYGALDVDLGFTPATNTLPIRRLDLAVGETARVRSAWIRFPELRLELLDQTYTRESPQVFRYHATIDGEPFAAALETDVFGRVIRYEGLWQAEPMLG